MTTPPESRIVGAMSSKSLFGGIFSLLLLLVLISCPMQEQTTAVLCTNRPEFTSYVESFNTSQDQYRIILSYNEAPRESITKKDGCDFDLIIDSHLNAHSYTSNFASLEGLFLEDQLKKESFYSDLLEAGRYEDQQIMLPVSFNLPGMIFSKSSELASNGSFMLSLETMAEYNSEFSRMAEERFNRLGLSLRWNPDLLFVTTMLKGSDFRESETGALIWNSSGLKSAVEYFRYWTFELNRGLSAEREFAQKFMVEPPYKLIVQGRIQSYYRNLEEFYSIPPQQRDQLSIRWLSEEGSIPILPDPLFAAIPHGAKGIEAAKAFLKWFFQLETQDQLLASTQYKRLRSFGIAGGFSSLSAVNEQVLPTYYSDLVGRIPTADYFRFPDALPPEWELIKDEVILPWLEEQAQTEITSELLSERLQTWMRQRPRSGS